MIKQFIIEQLGLKLARTEWINLLFGCPACGKKDHLSIRNDNGLWKCFSGCGGGGGNPYMLLRKIMGMDAQAAFKLLEDHGLMDQIRERKNLPPAKGAPKIKPSEREEITQKDLEAFCKVKGLDPKAFMLLKPQRRVGKREFLIPAYNPHDTEHVNGWIRVGMDGQDCPIKYRDGSGKLCEKLEKYPLLKGSKAGLVGIHHAAVSKEKTIIFAEGWKDAVKALEFGYVAVAGSNGAGTFRDPDWLIMFRNKKVVIVFDRDDAGVKGGIKAAEAVSTVAKSVHVVYLPYKLVKDHGKDLYDYLMEVRE